MRTRWLVFFARLNPRVRWLYERELHVRDSRPGASDVSWTADRQGNLLDDVDRFLEEALEKTSIFAFFHRERDALFPDEDFADLFDKKGRNSVPPSVVAVVMALQRLEGAVGPRGRGALHL